MARPKKATTKAKKNAELAPTSDPRAPLDGAAFLKAAQRVLRLLAADLAKRATTSPAVTATLKARHAAEVEARRTADVFVVWQQSFVEQVAAAWLLSCVFARVLEDRGLLGRARIAGPGATDSQHLFLELAPSLTERDYLLTVFRELSRFAAARDLFDARHNPVWLLAPSAQVTKELLALFRTPNANEPAFRFGASDTRFLGDLYQDLSEDVKKRFALLQTPRFVESFILDRTLERAIERFGLNETTLIDPTCGSGHFLLGAFERLFDHRLRAEPGLEPREAARKALDAVFGADINPYAVAIARFRLTLAYLEKAGFPRLKDAPALPLHLVVADSLLHNPQARGLSTSVAAQKTFGDLHGQSRATWDSDLYQLEDEAAARDVLHRKYAAVVGNPPYITVKDAVLRERYREMYQSAAGKYSLAAPFAERFFQLACDRGAVGMITANSFMKREFGKKLIEDYLPSVNLDLVANTSGAYIPGHGTPTVLLFGTAEPAQGKSVHTVLASRGEPSTPEDPERGLVWRSIADHWSEAGFENDYVTVMRFERATLSMHPWSLGGGGASELKELIEGRAEKRLGDVVDGAIGRGARTSEDEVYTYPAHVSARLCIPDAWWMDLLIGESIRDWSFGVLDRMLFPYDRARGLDVASAADPTFEPALRHLWPYRTRLANRATFQGVMKDAGLQWYEYMQYTPSANRTPLSIAFAFVATHNHFVLDRGGKVFKQTAPIIKLPESATEDDHYALLAYLNSSTACFWMKQVFHDKGSGTDTGKWQDEPAKIAYEFAGTQLGECPIPAPLVDAADVVLARYAAKLAQKRADVLEQRLREELPQSETALRELLARLEEDDVSMLAQLVVLQEELDWRSYVRWDLCARELVLEDPSVLIGIGVEVGHRPFELRLARRGLTTGIDDHRLSPTLPDHLPDWLAKLWENRCQSLDASAELRIIETPDYKRRWFITPKHLAGTVLTFERRARETLSRMLFEELEKCLSGSTAPLRAGDIIRGVLRNGFVSAAIGYLMPDRDATAVVTELLTDDQAPYISGLRFTGSGLEKHALWSTTWDDQRAEDAGASAVPAVPPKYAREDYATPRLWELRGKLDVPKERFISYPGCESNEDREPVYGWAGWNHLQRAQALAALYQDRKQREGWSKDRLTPMLAGLLELIPWLKQWHNEPNQEFEGLRLGDYFHSYLEGECRELGLTVEELRDWRPERKSRAARPTKKAWAAGVEGD